MNSLVKLDRQEITSFCKKNHIKQLSLFGSVLRNDFGSESDVDVLVEFEEGHTPGFSFFRLEKELSVLLGRTVDLNTPNFLSRYIRDRVIREAEVLYAKTG